MPATPSTADHPIDTPDELPVYIPERPSKTRLKQQSHDLQSLGASLTALSDAKLAALDISESLRDAIGTYRKTRSHEGRRRQMQYIGKLMRQADEKPLREAVAEAEIGSARQTLLLHEGERWRDALLADDEAATRWIDTHPRSDAQRLRSLVRAARREAAVPGQRQSRAHRELFQFIKSFLADENAADDEGIDG
jgi:ribosome-associated protein